MSRIDHVIVGISNLEHGIDEFERRTGVRPVFGGVHPARGTQNALVSLGNYQYLEIMAPRPGEPLRPDNQYLLQLGSLKAAGWAVRAEDLVSLQKTLREQHVDTAEILPGARNRPDGTHLAWKSMAYAGAGRLLPFFIQWETTSPHPSTTSPGGCKLTGLVIQGTDVDGLRNALRAANLDIEVRQASAPAVRIALSCPKGMVEF